jgi:malate dehydrogenase (oxaloacetate-decarboxylating)(NADP+)
MLVGLSVKDAFSEAMIVSMNPRPIIFALANPDPEIDYDRAKKIRPDAIVATGRSDYPNQVNNVLGFPYIFRGALDVRATAINEEMKVAAVHALAELAREDVPDAVIRSYGGRPIQFGTEYIIPKPLDTRVLLKVVPAVAAAAVESGVARGRLTEMVEYTHRLEATLGPERETMRNIITTAQQDPKRIVLPEGEHPVILRAAYQAAREGIAHPLLIGNGRRISELAGELQIPLKGLEIIDPADNGYFDDFAQKLFKIRSRKGWTMTETRWQLGNPYVFGAMMVHEGMVEGQVHGIDQSYPNAIRPVLQVIPRRLGVSRVSGLYLMIIKHRSYLLADTTVNIHPDAETLAEIAILAAEMAEFFNMEPRVAMLSYSNFGSVRDANTRKVVRAVGIARRCRPELLIDGEMQADTAVVAEVLDGQFPFNRLGGPANVLIFSELSSGNMVYKLLERLGGAKAVGPLLMGISKPFNVLQRNTDMENVVNVIAITGAQGQRLEQARSPYCALET